MSQGISRTPLSKEVRGPFLFGQERKEVKEKMHHKRRLFSQTFALLQRIKNELKLPDVQMYGL